MFSNFKSKYTNLKTILLLLTLFTSIFFTSCSSDDFLDLIKGKPNNGNNKPAKREKLVDYSFGKKFSKKEVLDFEKYFEQLKTIDTYINTGFKVFDLAYKTKNGLGEDILNSGIVLVPSKGEIKGVISYQPGTVFFEEYRTTNYIDIQEGSTFTYFSFLAANGYVVFAADYAGFGLSKDEKHPYNIPDKLAVTAYDFIKAGYEFLNETRLKVPNKLFITGYSEGGLSNLALTRLIEEEGEIELTASVCGAGAYDIAAFSDIVKFVIANGLPANQFVPLLFDSYNYFFFKRPSNLIFAEPYATRINNGLFDGGFDGRTIVDNLPSTYNELLNPEFTAAFITSQDAEVEKYTRENTYVGNGWVPTTPMLLYTGKNDLSVVPVNTENLVKYYLENGKQNLRVEVDEADHVSGRGSYNKIVLDYFNEF